MTQGKESSLTLQRQESFKLLSATVSPATREDAHCVRYSQRVRELDNPRSQGKPLIMQDEGLVCQHPSRHDFLALAMFSQRFPEGHQLAPELYKRYLNLIAEPVFASIAFP